MKKRKICIITGSRAEWGLLYPLAAEIRKNEKELTLQIIATGAHLSVEYGSTYKEIENDGFVIDKKIESPLQEDTEEATVRVISADLAKLADALGELKPDLVCLLGDRFEIFSAVVACLFLKIPVAHIHGGELTRGSLDDTLRHSITKMSRLHFVSAETYKKRVIQMGEGPSTVFNVGAIGLDNVKNTKLLSKDEFQERTRVKLGTKNIMVTFSPMTAEERSVSVAQFENLVKVLDEMDDARIIFTKPNPDLYSKKLAGLLDEYIARKGGRCVSFASMGRVLYLSALQYMTVVAGNSSSGIIEVPSFGVPTINIGSRQEGRIRADSVIDADGSYDSIKMAFTKASRSDFQKQCRTVKNPYGEGNAAARIVDVIKNAKVPDAKKTFHDIEFELEGK